MARTQYTSANYWEKKDGEFVLSLAFKTYNEKVRYAPYGSARRALMMKLFDDGLEFPVNRTHCPSTEKDPDIKKLLKDGKIEMFNVRRYDSHKTTHLRKKGK